jgi:hypothetical protein
MDEIEITQMKKILLIGIHGKYHSGKDTVARAIMRFFPGRFKKMKFAAKLKKCGSIITGEPLKDFYSEDGKKRYLPLWGMTIGEWQQKFGSEACRDGLHKDTWVIAELGKYDGRQSLLCSDVRFLNELQAIRDRGGILIRVVRPQRDTSGRDVRHQSETSLDNWTDWDFEIINDGTLKDLKAKVNNICAQIRFRK